MQQFQIDVCESSIESSFEKDTSLLKIHKRTISHKIKFLKVNKKSKHFNLVKIIFSTTLKDLYGCQQKAIEKIKSAIDRSCEIMFMREEPIGLLVYKNQLQEEYGLKNGLELKTLLLMNPVKYSGNGFGSKLFSRVDEIAEKMNASIIYCTASSKASQSIKCAMKNGYKIDRVLEKNKEHILYLLIKEL